jgi:transcriptional regulator NrdR family protein
MKCYQCGAWTEVLETRKADRGHTLRRTRECANGHRFPTFEVFGPIYRKDPSTVRQTTVAAEVRAVTWRRDVEIARMARTETHAAVAVAHGLSRQAVTKAVKRIRSAVHA